MPQESPVFPGGGRLRAVSRRKWPPKEVRLARPAIFPEVETDRSKTGRKRRDRDVGRRVRPQPPPHEFARILGPFAFVSARIAANRLLAIILFNSGPANGSARRIVYET
jgi:hypothetical protein